MAEGAQETFCMDKITERRVAATCTEAPKYKSHLKLQSTTQGKYGLGKAMLSKKNPEVLSPLILSPYEDIECAGCPFVLEEPLPKEEQHSVMKTEAKAYRKHSIGGKVNMQRSYQDMRVGRTSTPWTGIVKDWKPQNQLISSSSTSKRTSKGSFLGAWDFSSSDEKDILDYPRNVLSIPCSSLEKQHQRDITVGSRKNSRNGVSMPNPNGLQFALPVTCMPYATDDGISFERESGKASCMLRCEAANASKEGAAAESSLADQHSLTSGMELTVVTEQPSRSLSQKYRPRVFDELVGQELVIQALSNAIVKGKIAPVYLFHGSRGTGKTSTARILAAALNCCTMHVDRRPCTFCTQCNALALGKSSGVWEVDAASHSGVEDVYALVQKMLSTPSHSRYKVFIIDECHMLTDETWNALLNFLEEPPGDFVFILVTTDLDSLPCTASSRCQKYFFMKVKHSDIVKRLNKLVDLEGLDVEHGALELIASRSEGSLRDAEMTLDQLSLFGQTITSSIVHDLVGPVSDERILNLLDLALGSDTVRTAQKAKELVHSGVEPLDLMTQLARLITDILAGSHKVVGTRNRNPFVLRHMCSKQGLEGLSSALRILLEAKKQVKVVHHDRMAWLMAALLQLGRYQQPRFLLSSSTSATTSPPLQEGLSQQKGRHLTNWTNTKSILNKMSPRSDNGNWATTFKPKARLGKPNLEARIHPTLYPFTEDTTQGGSVDSSEAGSSPFSSKGSERRTSFFGPGNLGNLWVTILKGCKSLPLRHLLSHGKLLAVCFSTVEAMVHLEFKDPEQKFRAERYRKVIANTCKKGLGLSVNVKISLASQPIREELLASPLPLLAEGTQIDEDCSEECVDALGLEPKVLIKFNKNEMGSLQHWRDQSRQIMMKHDYSAYNMPLYCTSVNSLSVQTRDKKHPFGGDVDFLKSEAVLSQERNGVTWAGTTGESTAGYWQNSPGLQEHKNTLRCSGTVENHAASTLDSTDRQHAQGPPHGSALPHYENESNPRLIRREQESLGLEAQRKYEKLLCWKVPIEEEKPLKRRPRRRCRAFCTFIPCGKTTS